MNGFRTVVPLFLLSMITLPIVAEEQMDPRLDAVVQQANLRVQREAIQMAARPMFNNVNDWQRWAKQVNGMAPNQLNGLMNILNAQQRQMLAQQQAWLFQRVRQQWLQQQLWLQQNALANLPFGIMPHGFNQPRVYYAPIVQWFPQGVQFNAGAVVSPDRRSVRLNLNPIFSSIGPVYHYNMANGAYYQPNAYRYGYGHNNTHHSRVQRANYRPPVPQQPTRQIPDWYRRIRNNP